MKRRKASERWHARAEDVIVGGVNSPSRSFKAVGGGAPVTMTAGHGAYLYDVDGNRYIDYLAAYGPVIAGHSHPHIVAAIQAAAQEGTLFGVPTPWETLFAEKLRGAIPELERLRLVNSGTEAVMSAIRVARAFTGKSKILKFAGCYHGHADLVLVAAGSGPSSLGIPDSAGVPESIARDVITVPYNDIDAFERAFERYGDELALVAVEPVVGNFGIVTPTPGFLETVRARTAQSGVLLLYDEVITAFRFRYGAVDYNDVRPDLYTLGKIIGGGLPIGAYGGKRSIMDRIAPLGPAYQAGTLAGNPASVRAGLACLEVLEQPAGYERMEQMAARLERGILEAAAARGVPATINRFGGAFTLFFGEEAIRDYEGAKRTDGKAFAVFFHAMLDRGVCLAPSKYEAWFTTLAHTDKDVDETLEAVWEAMIAVKNSQTSGR